MAGKMIDMELVSIQHTVGDTDEQTIFSKMDYRQIECRCNPGLSCVWVVPLGQSLNLIREYISCDENNAVLCLNMPWYPGFCHPCPGV